MKSLFSCHGFLAITQLEGETVEVTDEFTTIDERWNTTTQFDWNVNTESTFRYVRVKRKNIQCVADAAAIIPAAKTSTVTVEP